MESIILQEDLDIEEITFTGTLKDGTQISYKGYVSPDKKFVEFSKDLYVYRYSTHKKCSCGNIMKKEYTLCGECRSKKEKEKYNSLPKIESWKYPIGLFNDDRIFFEEGDLSEYIYENEITEPLMLCPCIPVKLPTLDFIDFIDERSELEDSISDLICEKDYIELKELENKINEKIEYIEKNLGYYETDYSKRIELDNSYWNIEEED